MSRTIPVAVLSDLNRNRYNRDWPVQSNLQCQGRDLILAQNAHRKADS